MQYDAQSILKNGDTCILRSGTAADGAAALEFFQRTHAQSDYLLTYPDETQFDAAQEADFLKEKLERMDEIELLAVVNGAIAGMAGFSAVGRQYKLRHRAEFGVSVEKSFWGMGVGRALTLACIECAKRAGYRQLELDVVAENRAAIALYESVGFERYGCYPHAFRSRFSGWQDLLLMYLELQ